VDDSEAIQMLYSLELADEGYEVFTSKCNAQVFHRIEQKNPDLIVLDHKPDKHNGRNLLQDIRSAWCDIPVILCMACPVLDLDKKSYACEYAVVKSSDLSELKHKVKMALRTESMLQHEDMLEEV
jgi:DNA-binding response OmpR family regulator